AHRMFLLWTFVSLAAVSSGMFVVTQSPDVSVMEGETVNITCCWTGMFERAGVAWLKNQTVIKREAKFFQSHGSLKKEAKTCSSLNISNIRTEDSGTYICKVTVEIPSLFESKGNRGGLKTMCREFAVLAGSSNPRPRCLLWSWRVTDVSENIGARLEIYDILINRADI
uniref:Ig-like domain-containing protein n=1 Tax=Oreochromis aureus TaxID=47969 RepID=A0AAZ1XN17_OREAU